METQYCKEYVRELSLLLSEVSFPKCSSIKVTSFCLYSYKFQTTQGFLLEFSYGRRRNTNSQAYFELFVVKESSGNREKLVSQGAIPP